MIRVQQEDFDVGKEISALSEGRREIGGVCCFVGLVREIAGGAKVDAMTLEAYHEERYIGW